jgi:hypothetical protein
MAKINIIFFFSYAFSYCNGKNISFRLEGTNNQKNEYTTSLIKSFSFWIGIYFIWNSFH